MSRKVRKLTTLISSFFNILKELDTNQQCTENNNIYIFSLLKRLLHIVIMDPDY